MTELQAIDFNSKRTICKSLSRHGFRYNNVLYTSEWLEEARKTRVLKDKKKYDLKISHWDIRYVYIVNPETNEIETLTAYKFDGDNRVNEFLRQGLGKVSSFKPFPVSLNLIKNIEASLGNTATDQNEKMAAWELTAKKVQEHAKRNKKERKFLDILAKTKDGKEVLTQSTIIAQLEKGTIVAPSKRDLSEKINSSLEPNQFTENLTGQQREDENNINEAETNKKNTDDGEIEPFPTELDQIPDDMKLSYMKR